MVEVLRTFGRDNRRTAFPSLRRVDRDEGDLQILDFGQTHSIGAIGC